MDRKYWKSQACLSSLGKNLSTQNRRCWVSIKSLEATNSAFLRKLAWRIMTSDSIACIFLKKKFTKDFRHAKEGPVLSSIWPVVRNYYKELVDERIWIVGNQFKVNFWKDNRIGYPIVSKINTPNNIPLNALVDNFIHDNRGRLPQSFYDAFPNIFNDIRSVSIVDKTWDELRWRHCVDGLPKVRDYFYDSA